MDNQSPTVIPPGGPNSPEDITKKKRKINLPKFNLDKLKNLNRNAVLAGVLAAVLLIVGLSLFVFGRGSEEVAENQQEQTEELQTALPMGAVVSLSEGVVEHKVGEEWEKLPEDLEIKDGTSIRTVGGASRAIVNLDDGSAIRLDAGTEINFETLTVNRVVVHQYGGNVYNRIVPSSTRTYIIQTKVAQYQALGTAFKTTDDGDEESVEVYHNKVKESTINKNADEGQKLTVSNLANPDKNGEIEPIDIELLKEDQFIAWNRAKDLEDENFKDDLGFLSDFDGPNIQLTSPQAGSTVEIPAGESTAKIVFEGKSEVGASLTVQSKSSGNSKPEQVAITSDGTFKSGEITAPVGNSVFEFIATDKRGNKTTLSITLNIKNKAAEQTGGISLNVDSTTDPTKLKFTWSLTGITTPDGVKLVFSESSTKPEFGKDSSILVETGTNTEVKKTEFSSGKTINFRVCRYIKSTGSCDFYSNVKSVEIP